MSFERLSDEEWLFLERLVRTSKSLRGRPPKKHREIFDAVFWMANFDVPWRSLPPHFGKWNTVYRQFKRWSEADLWNIVLAALEVTEPKLDALEGLRPKVLSTRRLAEQRNLTPQNATLNTFGSTKPLETRSHNL